MAVEITNLGEEEGLSSITRFIDIAQDSSDLIKFKWVWLDKNSDNENTTPFIEADKIIQNMTTKNTNFVNFQIEKKIVSYRKIKIHGTRTGAIELSEDMTGLVLTFTRNNVLHLGSTGFIILLTEIIIIWILGHFLLTKRINKILEYIREIGSGNLSISLNIKGHDEISIISNGLDKMRINLGKAQKQLIKSKNDKINLLMQLRHSDRLSLIGRISSGIAHELGTPLNIISGRAKLIRNEKLTKEELIKNSEIISEQSERISGIIREFLKFARRKKIQKENTSLNLLIKKTVALLKPEARKLNISIVFNEDDSDIKLYLDEIQIQQVFSNIILNAIHALSGEGKIEIAISYKKAKNKELENALLNKYAVVSIKDNGPGIYDKDIKHIFEPYFTTKDTGKGTGLGLSLSSDIVKEHNGWIDVSNNQEKGCCFHIYLPCDRGE